MANAAHKSLLVGGTTAMQQLLTTAQRISETTVSVLIHGETGSGKELIARHVHECSQRSDQPFCAVNCAALPSTLIESTLFGHERGAFTGAHQTQVGVFERAHGGTLFLDEVGDLSLAAQATLLRAIETRRITRIGGRHELPADVRLVSATHRELQQMVEAGSFRADLLFRINTVTLDVPPLRHRTDELPALISELIVHACQEWGRAVPDVAPEVVSALRHHPFPGNIRELKNLVERALAVSDSDRIELCHLPEAIRCRAEGPNSHACRKSDGLPEEVFGTSRSFKARLRAFERHLLLDILQQAGGNHARAAVLAGLPLRTLTRRLALLDIRKLPSRRSPPLGAQ